MNDQPRRVQLSRAKGWRKPDNTIVVARPSQWGNPFKVGDTVGQKWAIGAPVSTITVRDREHAVELFRQWLTTDWFGPRRIREEIGGLRGKNIACWCPLDQPCHADVLLELANRPQPSGGSSL